MYFFGFCRNSTISLSSSSASSTPATSANRTFTSSSGVDLRAAARERHHAALGAAHPPEEEAPDADEEEQRDDPAEQARAASGSSTSPVYFTPCASSSSVELRILDPRDGDLLAGLAAVPSRHLGLEHGARTIWSPMNTSATSPLFSDEVLIPSKDHPADRREEIICGR